MFCASFVFTAEAKPLTFPLTRLAPVGVVDLKGPASSYGIKVPIPERWDLRSATLRFTYVNSNTLKDTLIKACFQSSPTNIAVRRCD